LYYLRHSRLPMPDFLVIDDSPTVRKMIMAALRPLAATFSEAATGLEAIEKLTLRKHDAITLDLNMPDMHGLEFLQFLRQHSVFQDVPVMVVTTRSDEEIAKVVMEAGANSFLVKPFKPDDLLQRMQKLLEESGH
jgi:two-component system, chemotaxis family, chemotaxis protein CheY